MHSKVKTVHKVTQCVMNCGSIPPNPGGYRHAARRRRGAVLEERAAAGHPQHQGLRGPEGRRQG